MQNNQLKGNPGLFIDQPNIYYFLVFGTGNLDSMLKYSTQPGEPAQQVVANINLLCTLKNGCLGPEIAHKYNDGSTSDVYADLVAQNSGQIAAFHTVPQYSWYWWTLPTQKLQALTYGKTFPRTDGSCSFALTDTLNLSTLFGNEVEDLRNLFSWNENNFSTITTDEPLLVLRDLNAQGKRSTDTAGKIGGTNTAFPSGGQATDIGPIRDGLYMILNQDDGKYLGSDTAGNITASYPTTPALR